jgi:putative addiction module component (TIGR02574 family)
MTTKELIDEAVSLPLEQRVMLVDILLRSLNQPESEIDREWGTLAQRRLQEIRDGKVEGIAGEEVFRPIRERFGQ